MALIKNDFIPSANSEIQAALALILASCLFVNTTRMARLLIFLFNKTMTGAERETSEYAIGIEVFDKDPATYSTYEDAVVRVQIKRLRCKLLTYYASLAIAPDIQITLPIGCYLPVITHRSVVDESCTACLLSTKPLPCVSQPEQNVLFMQGLNEELIHHLFKAFGSRFLLTGASETQSVGLIQGIRCGAKHLLTGSFRSDAERLRVCIRLLDASEGQIVWSEQFDRSAYYSISHQEELALAICAELKLFFGHEQLRNAHEIT